jgi:hypothetical protein
MLNLVESWRPSWISDRQTIHKFSTGPSNDPHQIPTSCLLTLLIFSSPGHRPCELLSWVSIRRPSVRPSVSFSHLNLLLWNRWTEISQTWQKCSLDGHIRRLLVTGTIDTVNVLPSSSFFLQPSCNLRKSEKWMCNTNVLNCSMINCEGILNLFFCFSLRFAIFI